MSNNLPVVLRYLFPDGAGWVVQDDSDGRGPYLAEWSRPEPRPTDAQIAAAEPAALAAKHIADLIDLAGYHATKLGCALTNPLTGYPISTETNITILRNDAFVAERYCLAALSAPGTPQAVKDSIAALFTERDRLMGVFLALKSEIENGAITTDAQVVGDSRW